MLDVCVDHKRFSARILGGTYFSALQGVRFSLAEGEFACLVGPSGCGKSTLLNVIGGLDRDMEGWVSLDGVAPDRGISYMFQTPRLMPWLTVLDNVRLVLGADTTATAKARQILTSMGLGEVVDAYPNRLSGGMQRRAALARAFAIEPRLLLMDEPFLSLDAPAANRLRAMLVELWQTHHTTVLFVTHDLREALALGDRVLFMSNSPGRVVLEVPVDLPRPRTLEDPVLIDLQTRLLARHPDLLEGRLANTAQSGAR